MWNKTLKKVIIIILIFII